MDGDAQRPVILWFRQDLRLADNPALAAAAATGRPVLPVYILDETGHARRPGAASLWWLDKSLRALDADIRGQGGRLVLRRGDSESELRRLIDQTGADLVFLNRRFEPDAFAHDADIAYALRQDGIECRGFNAALLARPGAVLTGSGQPYKVFTPFFRALSPWVADRASRPSHTVQATFMPQGPKSDDIDAWSLHPQAPDWSGGFKWTPGEKGAGAALSRFIAGGLKDYAMGRDVPGRRVTSHLSPHLHWGELSPRTAIHAVRAAAAEGLASPAQANKFVAEMGWREFSAHLLHHFPYMVDRAFRPAYDQTPWRVDPGALDAWKTGRTGYPLVDAGMRELWVTGWMHNRVRMVTASFLVKHLLIDWREGEAWFWDTLVDADHANNVQNWQWVAGCGADAAPWFRIFNPVAQGQKFDPDGRYVRRWAPEIAGLPDRWIHAPWTAPDAVLAQAGVRLGLTYPRPIVDHATARARALDALKSFSAPATQEDRS